MKKTKNSNTDGFRTLRVHSTVYTKIQTLAEEIRSAGWISFGSDRSDVPTLTAVIEESVNALVGRRRKR